MGTVGHRQMSLAPHHIKEPKRSSCRSVEENIEAKDSTSTAYGGRNCEQGTAQQSAYPRAYQPVPMQIQHGGVIYPIWVPSYMVQRGYAPASYWQPSMPYAEGPTWAPKTQNRQPPPSISGTGVFLPATSSTADVSQAEQQCAESDGDSAESASDCIMLDESAPVRRGQWDSSVPIELLLPDEWEY